MFLPAYPRCHANHQSGGVTILLLWAVLILCAVSAAAYTWHLLHNTPADGQGLIRLTDIQTVREADELSLQANADVELSSTIQAGLDSGVPLTFVLSLRVFEPRRWWLDTVVLDREQHYHLTYTN